MPKKKDYFETYRVEPTYKDPVTLKRFVTSRGKIVAPEKSGLTAKNQRKLARHIKYARYLALLPYNSYQVEKLGQSSSA
ncbi:30S ribosomal protein S18 [Candidatus Roizmanbacteria bacterium RIFCSPHIGHO2_12_FULL_44_10]|uniref:Small ribosomal subunit protein bS18 n=1 Tax=Candidatus Roizmanbacteria bacterium RIFCSPHIGHO2_12_FULL_44_10 TaxID=1802054 RepID=A0A1F7I8Y7_9BACT|nr:MAG: 30S ribosomal protein S18 [Candidatus Roizmanbacteria bacterium RIFCSPHIGHO2_12_FULL_44_10]